MIEEKRPLIKLQINVLISGILLVVMLFLVAISFVYGNLFGKIVVVARSVFLVLMLTAAGFLGGSIKRFMDRLKFYRSLLEENYYTLGSRNAFYNLEAFKEKVRELKRSPLLKRKKQYLLAFSPTATTTVGGANRSRVLQNLNQTLAFFINRIMMTKENINFSRRNAVYAFDRNSFLFYLFADEEVEVHGLIGQLQNECFRLVNEEKIKIWVQPFSGICRVEDDASLPALIERALIAKAQSELNIESFSYYKESFMTKDTQIADDILKGIENKEFIPYYQGKFSLKEKKFVSCEVLARWKTPEGILGPGKFIERAGRSGLLNAIDMEIFEGAMRDLGDSLKRGRRVLPVSVNFSLYEFFSNNFLENIVAVLQKNQVPPSLLEIEITETTSQVNKFLSLQVIKKLKDIGVRILMDDFGIGFSQIENLRQIPFDAVKIDKSFTDRILEDEKTRSIVKFLVTLIHENDMEAIVEGVETKEQVEMLRKMKVDTIQGFYYSRPISFAAYNDLLKENAFEGKGVKK